MSARPRASKPPPDYSPLAGSDSYLTAIRGAPFAHKPSRWRFPSFWAFSAGVALQFLFGMAATAISLLLLVIADARRCPVAVGAPSMRPFFAWVLGVILGIIACEHMQDGRVSKNPNASWVFWGMLANLYRLIVEYP